MIELTFTISGASPDAASTTAVIGEVVDFAMLPGTTQPTGLEVVDDLDIVAAIQGGTGGSLDLFLQTSPDNVTWTDYAHFAQLAAGAVLGVKTFATTRQAQTATMTTVGQNLTPLLAASTVVGSVARYMRLLAIAGAGTTAGAVQTITLVAHGSRRMS